MTEPCPEPGCQLQGGHVCGHLFVVAEISAAIVECPGCRMRFATPEEERAHAFECAGPSQFIAAEGCSACGARHRTPSGTRLHARGCAQRTGFAEIIRSLLAHLTAPEQAILRGEIHDFGKRKTEEP